MSSIPASVKISSLPIGVATTDSFLIVNNAANTATSRVTAGAIAALSGPVVSVNGVTGAVSLSAASIGAASAGHVHNATAVTDFVTAVATRDRWETVTISNSVINTVADVYRLTASTVTELRGITNAVRDGSTRATFINVGVNAVTFVHNHSTDSAAFLCPGGVNFSLAENQWAFGRYDPTSQRWRVTPNCCGGT